jgi:hypothetical protein
MLKKSRSRDEAASDTAAEMENMHNEDPRRGRVRCRDIVFIEISGILRF